MENFEEVTRNVGVIAGKVKEIVKTFSCGKGNKQTEFKIEVKRLSGVVDNILTQANESVYVPSVGDKQRFIGELRTYRFVDKDGSSHLKFVFLVTQTDNYIEDENAFSILGYLCKKPVLRTTPRKKTVCDLNIRVVNGEKNYYIPAIAWEAAAKFMETLEPNAHIYCYCRLQSRIYEKTIEGEKIKKEVMELSIFKVYFPDLEDSQAEGGA